MCSKKSFDGDVRWRSSATKYPLKYRHILFNVVVANFAGIISQTASQNRYLHLANVNRWSITCHLMKYDLLFGEKLLYYWKLVFFFSTISVKKRNFYYFLESRLSLFCLFA